MPCFLKNHQTVCRGLSVATWIVALSMTAVTLLATDAVAEATREKWTAPSFRARKKNPIAADAKSIAIGKRLYAKECLSCHGPTGKGDGSAAKDLEVPPGNLSSPRLIEQSDGALFWKITTGRAPMSAMESLMSEEQRWHVVNYVRTLSITAPRFNVAAAHRQAISKAIQPYLKVTAGIVANPPAVPAAEVQALKEAAQALPSLDMTELSAEARSVWQDVTNQVLTAARALAEGETDVEGVRPRLNTLSTALEKLVSSFGHAEASPVVSFRGDKGLDPNSALWLQTGGEARNPYAKDASQRKSGQAISCIAPAAASPTGK